MGERSSTYRYRGSTLCHKNVLYLGRGLRDIWERIKSIPSICTFFINFVRIFLDGWIHKDRAYAKQSLLRWSCPLPSIRLRYPLFQLYGRIYSRMFNVRTKPRTAGPITDFAWLPVWAWTCLILALISFFCKIFCHLLLGDDKIELCHCASR